MVTIIIDVNGRWVKESDYLKVVEEKENIEKYYEQEKEIRKERDEEIKVLESRKRSLEINNEDLFKLTKFISEERNCYGRAGDLSVDVAIDTIKKLEKEIKKLNEKVLLADSRVDSYEKWYNENECEFNKMKEMVREKDDEIERLKNKHNEILVKRDEEIKVIENKLGHYIEYVNCLEQERKEKDNEIKELTKRLIVLEYGDIVKNQETWTLSYSYVNGFGDIMNFKQSGLLKEEYEEMYGMDSDNWLSHSLVKDRKEVK